MIVQKQQLTLQQPFITEGGDRIEHPVVAYEEYGVNDGPVIFIAHGGLSSAHAAGKYDEAEPLAGWWDGLIGPGKVFDTNRFRVLCTNSLGSMYGSSSARTDNPLTGCRYGPLFPKITLRDTVRFQKAFLDQLGIEHLYLMAGPSMGSLQTLQMAALYPDFVGAAVAVATAGRMTPDGMSMHHLMSNMIRMDARFQGGWYDPNESLTAMRLIAQLTKLYYLHEKILKKVCWDSVEEGPGSQQLRSDGVNRFLQATSDSDIADRDPNCYLTILEAVNSHDLGAGQADYASGVRRIQCPLLVMNIDTDREFDISWGEELVDILNDHNPGQATLKILESDWGHLGCIKETEQMACYISHFLTEREYS